MFQIDIFQFQYIFVLIQLVHDNLPLKKKVFILKRINIHVLQEQKEYLKIYPLNQDYMDQ
jgi:hypothetical protein